VPRSRVVEQLPSRLGRVIGGTGDPLRAVFEKKTPSLEPKACTEGAAEGARGERGGRRERHAVSYGALHCCWATPYSFSHVLLAASQPSSHAGLSHCATQES